jgi:hypothetical protein
MNKKEIADNIRGCLEDMPCPICTIGFSDEDMIDINDCIENMVKQRFNINEIDFDDEDQSEAWWEELEEYALEKGMIYYEDMSDEEYDKAVKYWEDKNNAES